MKERERVVRGQIARLEEMEAADNPSAALQEALDDISGRMTRHAKQLQLEGSEHQIVLDPTDLIAGNIWTGRSLWSDADTERQIVPVRYQEGWTGLPPKSTWWTWLGNPFAEYQSTLPQERTTETKRGVLYEGSGEASGADKHSPLSDWLPPQLFSKLGPNPDDVQPVPLIKARAVPGDLRRG
ncbi:hypothetical protein MIPYR_30345 [uncultured Microbacterium sp.]|uniref:Uncharacterized protein n=1 Tax=uncultured Microbacterium sp. TaxID=191216 RepID=A0A1Y5P641_9MICO|nr:hypothetical protein MIPYR_30345 [uncultured Microbacterium sp.]